MCKIWDLTGGGVIAQDGTKVSASNSHKNNVKKRTVDNRIKRIDEKIDEYLSSMDQVDQTESKHENTTSKYLPPATLMKLLERKEKLESCKRQMEETKTEEISITDPDARMMGSPGKGFDIAYNVQIAVDNKHHIILECDVINNPTDRGEMSPMIKTLLEDGHINDETAYLADRGYYSGEDFADIKTLMEENETHFKVIVPRQNPPHPKDQPEAFWYNRFLYNKATDTYTCPGGHTLYPAPRKSTNKDTRHSYRNTNACKNCPHNKTCISGKTTYRVIKRGERADNCDEADKIYEENKPLYELRRNLAEHPFGTVKRYMNGSYFLLRTLPKVKAEAALFYLSYNIKRVSNVLGFKEIMARLEALLTNFHCFMHVIHKYHPNIPISRKHNLPFVA
jgi:hypothetical protein